MLTDSDERAHGPTGDPDWEESWYFDFVSARAEVAGYARLALRPGERRAWWWSAVVGPDLPYVLVREHDVELPRVGTLEVRGPGLWAEPVCETPFEHWGLGLEAFAVGLEDPADAYADERGESIPLGFDLEWEPDAEPTVWGLGVGHGRYGQSGSVHGEVLVGRRRLAITGTGTTEHTWGSQDWWPAESPPGRVSGFPPDLAVDLTLDDRGLLAGGRVVPPDGRSILVLPVRHAPLQVPAGDGRTSRLARALCRLEAEDGGAPPMAPFVWAERLQPA